jgi:hypothetical protein
MNRIRPFINNQKIDKDKIDKGIIRASYLFILVVSLGFIFLGGFLIYKNQYTETLVIVENNNLFYIVNDNKYQYIKETNKPNPVKLYYRKNFPKETVDVEDYDKYKLFFYIGIILVIIFAVLNPITIGYIYKKYIGSNQVVDLNLSTVFQ